MSDAVKYAPKSRFHAELLRRVETYFASSGRCRTGGVAMGIKAALFLGWAAASYVLLVFVAASWWQALALAGSLGLAVAGIGFNVQHDGSHGSFSRRRFVNRLAASALDLIGGSSYVWHHKHDLVHHHYTNVEGVDEDIEAAPFLRLAPRQRRRWYHRFQHLYVWPLYVFFPPKWELWDDVKDLVRGRVGRRRIPRPRGVDLAVTVAGKVAFVGWAFVLPFALHDWVDVVAVYAFYFLVLGVTLATVFQLAHCVEEAEFAAIPAGGARMENGWAEHQLATTVDFAPRNRWLTWYLGGLNYQVEHHLFPRVSHVHYPAVFEIVRRTCEEFGVRHRTHPTLLRALGSHVAHLRRMGRAG